MSGEYELREGDFGVSNEILRFADMDKDGYQDLMITAKNKSTKKMNTILFKNIGCSKDFYKGLGKFNSDFDREDCRTFDSKGFSGKIDALSSVDAYTASFFDFGEYG